jgi:hypothetical protein
MERMILVFPEIADFMKKSGLEKRKDEGIGRL